MRLGRDLQYFAYCETGHRTIGNLHLTLMQATGIPSPETLGQKDANLKTTTSPALWLS